MTFLSEESTQGVLVVAGIILGMFMLILLLAYLNNRSVHRLARRLRRGRAGDEPGQGPAPETIPGGSTRLILFVTTAILAAGLLLWFVASRRS